MQKCFISRKLTFSYWAMYIKSTGVFLPDLCKAQQNMPRRAMSQLLSSGGWISAAVAPAPAAPGSASSESHTSVACAPTSV